MKIAYVPGSSFFHRLDPLTKFTWAMVVTVWLFSLGELLPVIIISFGLTTICVVGAQIPLRTYVKSLRILLGAGVFIVLFQGFFREGVGIQIGPVHFSYAGLRLGLALALRSFAFIANGLAFSRTTSPRDVSLALMKMGMPYKLAHVGYLSLRFLPLLERDYQALNDAQKIRGIKPGFKQKQRSLITLIATELRRAEETAIALETRAFGLHETQTKLEEIAISKMGIALCGITLFIIAITILK